MQSSEQGRVEADLAILGAGPGGYVAAIRAAQLGARVALIEMNELGGCCLNRGCIPTKALLRSAELFTQIQRAKDYGISAGEVTPDFAAMMTRKERVVKQLRSGVEFLMKQNKITVVQGKGRLTSPTTIEVEGANGGQQVSAPRLVIATGSFPTRVPIPGADAPEVITSDDAVKLDSLPRSVAVIGGGAIGLEFGYIFRSLGATVTVIEMLNHILPLEDEEAVGELTRALKKQGIAIHAPAKVTEIAAGTDGRLAKFEAGGKTQEVTVEQVLMAVGRTPWVMDIGLEQVGVELAGRAIKANESMETSVPGIYAIGDATGGALLAHKASAEGKVAVENALGHQAKMSYRAIPNCLYTAPELASVGLSEKRASELGHEVKVGRFPFRASGKALAYGEREGLCKVVVEAGKSTLLGVQIVGPHATDLIAEAGLAVEHQMTAQQLFHTVHAHPTLAEVIMEAAEDALGQAIHK